MSSKFSWSEVTANDHEKAVSSLLKRFVVLMGMDQLELHTFCWEKEVV